MKITNLTHKIILSLAALAAVFTLSSALTACSATHADVKELKMASMSGMPEDVRSAPVSVRQSYQFAAANPEVLKNLPCYCGCGTMGHTSNYSCYIQSEEGQDIVFDTHALGCGICVDITLDAMRMMREGKSAAEIRTAIDQTYSQYGPSNMP